MSKYLPMLTRTINTKEDIHDWFTDLFNASFIIHPDEMGENYEDNEGNPSFTPEECVLYDALMEKAFEIADEEVYDIMLDIAEPGWREDDADWEDD